MEPAQIISMIETCPEPAILLIREHDIGAVPLEDHHPLDLLDTMREIPDIVDGLVGVGLCAYGLAMPVKKAISKIDAIPDTSHPGWRIRVLHAVTADGAMTVTLPLEDYDDFPEMDDETEPDGTMVRACRALLSPDIRANN